MSIASSLLRLVCQARIVLFAIPFGLIFPCQEALAAELTEAGGLSAYLAKLGYDSVSFKGNERNQPLVETEIGSRHHVFLADTGCRITILAPTVAKDLKTLGQLGVTLEDRILGRVTNSSVTLIDNLVIGSGQFYNQPAFVRPLEMDYIKSQFDGILGLDFFFRNFCLFDCYRRRLFLRAGQPSRAQRSAMEQSLRRSRFVEASMDFQHLLTIKAGINEQHARLLVDTGDSVSVLDQSLAKRLNLSSVKWDTAAEGSLIRQDISGNLVGFGRIGSHRVWVTMLDSFALGSNVWTNISYGVANLNDWGFSKLGGEEADLQGILGNDLLHRHGAIIDFSSLKLWFRPEKGHK